PGGTVKSDSELLALGVGALKIGVAPLLIFADKFDIPVPSRSNLFKASFEGQVAEYSPQHDRNIKGRCRRLIGHVLGASQGSSGHNQGSSNSASKFPTIHKGISVPKRRRFSIPLRLVPMRGHRLLAGAEFQGFP